jgi:dynein heavy chain
VLNSQDMSGLDETAGPLEEIEFWKARTQDLMGISKQLNKASVKRITTTLDLAKSSYIASFIKLSKQIQVRKSFFYILNDPILR